MYDNTMRQQAIEWIMDHLDGNAYSIHDISYHTKADHPTVRNAIYYLKDSGTIKAEQNGIGRFSRWRFYPKRDR